MRGPRSIRSEGLKRAEYDTYVCTMCINELFEGRGEPNARINSQRAGFVSRFFPGGTREPSRPHGVARTCQFFFTADLSDTRDARPDRVRTETPWRHQLGMMNHWTTPILVMEGIGPWASDGPSDELSFKSARLVFDLPLFSKGYGVRGPRSPRRSVDDARCVSG